MPQLYPFQEKTVKEIEKRKKIIIRTSQGLGKTVIACSFLKNHPNENVLIITPPIPDLILSWFKHLKTWTDVNQDEIQIIQKSSTLIDYSKRINMIPYTIFTKLQPLIDRKDILILDEAHYCFPYEMRVVTNKGLIPIGQIVENKLNVKVLSYNKKFKKLEWKGIKTYFKKPIPKKLLLIKHESGRIICTENHKLCVGGTKDGQWKEAKQIQNGENLLILWENILSSEKRKDHSQILFFKVHRQIQYVHTRDKKENHRQPQKENNQKMRMVWKRISGAITRCQKEKILFSKLFGQMAKYITSYKRNFGRNTKEVEQTQDWNKKSKSIRKNEAKQSDVEFRSKSENDCQVKRQMDWSAWRKATKDSTTTKVSTRTTETWISNTIGVCSKNCSTKTSIQDSTTTFLFNRYSNSTFKNSYRSRWQKTQIQPKTEVCGYEKKYCLRKTRVESVEILELGNRQQHSSGFRQNSFVYNIEVEDNHNYFVEGILVANCKDPIKAKRTKAVIRYCQTFKPEYIIMLTATPIYNKPVDLWTLLHLCNPKKFKSYWKFAIKYCGAYKTKYGYWEFPTGLFSKELKYLIEPYIVSWTWKTAGVPIPPKIIKTISFGKASKEIIDIESELMTMEDGLKKENLKKKQRLLCGLMKVNKVTNFITDFLIDKYPKIILFVWHRKVAEMYQEKLARHKIQTDIYYGGISNKQKQKILNEFRNGKTQVLIANWNSLGVGVNLEFCNCCIFGELDYTISAIEQALFRIYRLSSNPDEPKMIYFPFLEKSYEAKIVNILLEKEKTNQYLLGKSDFKLPFETKKKRP